MVDGLKQAYKADKEIVERKVVRVTSYMNEILQRHEQLLTAYKYEWLLFLRQLLQKQNAVLYYMFFIRKKFIRK